MAANNVDQALFQKLTADPGIAAILGTGAAGPAVYMGILPENAIPDPQQNWAGHWPAIAFVSITETDPAVSHDGASGLFRTRYQFTCWGSTMTDANNVSRALKKCLHGWRGTVGGYDLGPCLLVSAVSEFVHDENEFAAHLDFYIWNQG